MLKRLGVGLTALSRCGLAAAPRHESGPRKTLVIRCDDVRHVVRCLALDSHWLSVATRDPEIEFVELEWEYVA